MFDLFMEFSPGFDVGCLNAKDDWNVTTVGMVLYERWRIVKIILFFF